MYVAAKIAGICPKGLLPHHREGLHKLKKNISNIGARYHTFSFHSNIYTKNTLILSNMRLHNEGCTYSQCQSKIMILMKKTFEYM